MSKYVQYYGVDAPPPERMLLNAGLVSMIFEPLCAITIGIRLPLKLTM